VCLVLGDKIFYGQGFTSKLKHVVENVKDGQGATVFGYEVKDPECFGVVEFDKSQKAISIEEKLTKPKCHFAVTGLYFYDNSVVEFAKQMQASELSELEVTCLNEMYLK